MRYEVVKLKFERNIYGEVNMKKFFIILCGLLVTGNSFGWKPKNYQEPRYVGIPIVNAWKAAGGGYTSPLAPSTLYTNPPGGFILAVE